MRRQTCPACQKGQIVELARTGRRLPYRNIPDLELPREVAIPTCDACGAEWINEETSAHIDDALKAVYLATLPVKLEEALKKLSDAGVTQQQLERLLGLSAGYVSKLKSGKETSPQLVATLMLLAKDPVIRVAELRQLWKTAPLPVEMAFEADTDSARCVSVTRLPSPAEAKSQAVTKFSGGRRRFEKEFVKGTTAPEFPRKRAAVYAV